MKRLYVNLIAFVLTIICFYNLLALKGVTFGFWFLTEQYAELGYDISLAFGTGFFLYLLTSALPNFITVSNYKRIYKESLLSFVDDSLLKLSSIDGIVYTQDKESLKEEFLKLTYGSQVKKGSQNNIFETLNKINNNKKFLYDNCMKYCTAAGDFKKLTDLKKLIEHRIFSSRFEYLVKDFKEVENKNVGIGAVIKTFYDALQDCKNKIK